MCGKNDDLSCNVWTKDPMQSPTGNTFGTPVPNGESRTFYMLQWESQNWSCADSKTTLKCVDGDWIGSYNFNGGMQWANGTDERYPRAYPYLGYKGCLTTSTYTVFSNEPDTCGDNDTQRTWVNTSAFGSPANYDLFFARNCKTDGQTCRDRAPGGVYYQGYIYKCSHL